LRRRLDDPLFTLIFLNSLFFSDGGRHTADTQLQGVHGGRLDSIGFLYRLAVFRHFRNGIRKCCDRVLGTAAAPAEGERGFPANAFVLVSAEALDESPFSLGPVLAIDSAQVANGRSTGLGIRFVLLDHGGDAFGRGGILTVFGEIRSGG
jgi:hypothetical protein